MQKCMRCMGEIGTETFCPHCGQEIQKESWVNGQLPEGTILNKHYIVGQEIARDAMGITYVAWDAEKEIRVAIREWYPEQYCYRKENGLDVEYSFQEEQTKKLLRQFQEHVQLQEEKQLRMLVRILDDFRENATVYYTMEYVDGQTIQQLMQRENPLRREQAARIFHKIMKAAEKMHIHGVIHGNLTPANIVLKQDGSVCFLNSAWKSPELEALDYVFYKGPYAAPEYYQDVVMKNQDADIYSLYAVYYRMLTGQDPVDVEAQKQGIPFFSPSELGIRIEAEQEEQIMRELLIAGSYEPQERMRQTPMNREGGAPYRESRGQGGHSSGQCSTSKVEMKKMIPIIAAILAIAFVILIILLIIL